MVDYKGLADTLNAAVYAPYDFDIGQEAKKLGYTVGEIFKRNHKSIERFLEASTHRQEACYEFAEIARRVWAAGFYSVGSGYFSTVFKHPYAPGVVFKLSLRPDDAYAAYAMWVRDSPNRHAPKVHCISRGSNGIVFVLREYVSIAKAKKSGLLSKDFGPHAVEYRAIWNKPSYMYRRTLVKFVRGVIKFFDGAAHMDIHGENMMFDPESGDVIITDPVSYSKHEQGGSYYDVEYESSDNFGFATCTCV